MHAIESKQRHDLEIRIVAFRVVCPLWRARLKPKLWQYDMPDTSRAPTCIILRSIYVTVTLRRQRLPDTTRRTQFATPLRPRPNDWPQSRLKSEPVRPLSFHQQAPQQPPAFASIGRTRSSARGGGAGSSHQRAAAGAKRPVLLTNKKKEFSRGAQRTVHGRQPCIAEVRLVSCCSAKRGRMPARLAVCILARAGA